MRKQKNGFTLVEMMLVVAITGIIASIGPRLMVQLQSFYMLTTARGEIQRDARASLDTINRFLRQAKYRTIHIETPTNQAPFSRIRFIHMDERSMTFEQQGNKLIQTINGQTKTIAENLVYIAFTFPRSDHPKLVSVSITMGKTIYLGRQKELELTIQKIRVMN